MTNILSPLPKQKFFDNNGAPLNRGQLFTYQAGTTTKLTTYTDASGTTNSNPIVLDYRGECNLWIPPNISYKYVLAPANDTDPPTNPIWTVDNVISSQLITLYGGLSTGSTNAYSLSFASNFTGYADGIVIYFIPNFSNADTPLPVTMNVNGLGAVSIKNIDGTDLYANQILVNQMAQIIYQGTGFKLLSSVNRGGLNVQRVTTVQAFNASTVNTLVFNGITKNEGSPYNGSTGIYTAAVTGFYVFTSGVILQNNGVSGGALNAVYFSKNNATALGSSRFDFNLGPQQQGSTVTAASNPFIVTGAVAVDLTAGDTLRIKLDLGAGWTAGFATMNIGSTFSGVRIE